jgi:hypothetical protein
MKIKFREACTRCRFLRVDPAQLGRLEEMTANAEAEGQEPNRARSRAEGEPTARMRWLKANSWQASTV